MFFDSVNVLADSYKTEKKLQKSPIIMYNTNVQVDLRLQDTLFGVLWKIATARSKSVRFSSNFHQMLASSCKI
jgi:hypothetical protein